MEYRDLFEGTSFKYDEGMQLERVTDKDNRMHPAQIEQMTYAEDITPTDMFLLRGVMTFRLATARMVAEWIMYYRNRYGEEACKKLPLLSPDHNVMDADFGVVPEAFVLKIDGRLRKLARKSIVYRMMYTPSLTGGGGGRISRKPLPPDQFLCRECLYLPHYTAAIP